MLTPAQIVARGDRITASFAPWLAACNAAKIHRKWLELIGDPSWQPEDFSRDWSVQFGAFIEPFALDWHERRTQNELTRRGEVVFHPSLNYVAATLDAFRTVDRTVIDCKVTNGHVSIDETVAFYLPQLIVQRACAGADYCALLIVRGGAEPQEIFCPIDAEYEARMWERITQFQHCVETLTPPVEIERAPPLVPPEQWRTVDLNREADAHNWAGEMIEQLRTWAETCNAARANELATKRIKSILPEDVRLLSFEEITVVRNRARAVSIKVSE